MNRRKFQKELKNKELSINQSLDKGKSILEILRNRQVAIRTDMMNTVVGTKPYKELQNIRTILKKMVLETKKVQEFLLREKYSLDSLLEDYAADPVINAESNEDEVAVQERQAVYNSRLAQLDHDLEDFDDMLNNITSCDASVSDSMGPSEPRDLFQRIHLQSDTNDLNHDFADVSINENPSLVSSALVIEEGQPSSSDISFDRQAGLAANRPVLEEEPCPSGLRLHRVLNHNIQQMSVAEEQSDQFTFDQGLSRASSDIIMEEQQQDPSNILFERPQLSANRLISEEQQNPLGLRGRQALNRNIRQMLVAEEQPVQFATRANVEPLRRSSSDPLLVGNQWGPSNLLASSRYFPNRPMPDEQPGPSGLRLEEALNRNIRQMSVTEEQPVQCHSHASDQDLRFIVEGQWDFSTLMTSLWYAPRSSMQDEQPGASGLRPHEALQPEQSTSIQQAVNLGLSDSKRLANLAASAAPATSMEADAARYRLPPTTAEDDLRNTRPLLPFPEVCKVNEVGNIILQFHKSISVELTRDLGIYISCPNSGITIAASAHNHYFGLVHPQGKFYQRNGDLQIQILNSNDFERVARITNDDRLIAMHSKSDEITELSDFGPRKVEATTFFDLTRNFTKDVFYSEGYHGPPQAQSCTDLLETSMIERSGTFDRFILGSLKIVQMTNGSLGVYKNENCLRLQIFPLTGGIRINMPSLKLKADSRPNFLNFFVQRTFNRVISHNESFIVRRKDKTCGFDAYNVFHESFRRVRNEPRYSSDDEDSYV